MLVQNHDNCDNSKLYSFVSNKHETCYFWSFYLDKISSCKKIGVILRILVGTLSEVHGQSILKIKYNKVMD